MSTKPKSHVKKMKKTARRVGTKRKEKTSSERISLCQVTLTKDHSCTIKDLEWTISYSHSSLHIYNALQISTRSLDENQFCHVKMQIYAPSLFPGFKTFWHLFDCERRSFSIPFASVEENEEGDAKFQKLIYSEREPFVHKKKYKDSKLTREPFIRLTVSEPKDHVEKRNRQFPFADTILRVSSGDDKTKNDLYVNRRILYCSSRFFNRTIYRGLPTVYKSWEVFHLKYISFEDLYDLVGYIYNGWKFEINRSLHIQKVAEMFGVMYHSLNSEDFEGRTSLDALSSRCYNMRQRNGSVRYYDRVDALRTKLKIKLEEASELEEPKLEQEEEPEQEQEDDEDEEMQIDPVYAYWPGGDVLNIKDEEGNTIESFRTEPIFPDYEPELSKMPKNHPEVKYALELLEKGEHFFKTMEAGTVHKNRAKYGFYSFKFDPRYRRHERGKLITVNAGFVKWDMYLYRKTINGTEYFSLGIYMLGMRPEWYYETTMSVRVDGLNSNGCHKIFTHAFHRDLSNFGYPNFMKWSDLMNCTTGIALDFINVLVHVQVRFVKKHLPIVLPGVKDTQVQVQDQIFLVNREVLSGNSPVLKKLLRPGFIINRAKIHAIEGVEPNEFSDFLYCLYHRKSANHKHFGAALLQLAIRFKVDWMKDQMLRGFAIQSFSKSIWRLLDNPTDRVKYQMLLENWKGFHPTDRKKPLTLK